MVILADQHDYTQYLSGQMIKACRERIVTLRLISFNLPLYCWDIVSASSPHQLCVMLSLTALIALNERECICKL